MSPTAVLTTSFMLSTLFATFTQPLTMGLTLVLQTVLTGIMMFKFTKLSWYAYISIMVVVGGLLVSFVYVAVLIPIEPAARRSLWSLPVMLTPSIMIVSSASKTFVTAHAPHDFPIALFSTSSTMITIMLISFLLLALMMVVHNTFVTKGPMRSY